MQYEKSIFIHCNILSHFDTSCARLLTRVDAPYQPTLIRIYDSRQITLVKRHGLLLLASWLLDQKPNTEKPNCH